MKYLRNWRISLNIINNKRTEISELRIHIDQLAKHIATFEQDKADLKQHYTERVAELQQRTTTFQQQCHANTDKEWHHYEQMCNQPQWGWDSVKRRVRWLEKRVGLII